MKNLRSNNGSITLFILIAIIFFLAIVINLYINSKNHEQAVDSYIEEIKREYEKDINNIDEIYEQEISK